MKRVCLVEDEVDLSDVLCVYLRREGWEAISCQTLAAGREHLHDTIDVWVLDLMLPDGNGYELMKEIRSSRSGTPIVLISARGDGIDRVLGFEMGCDDYIAKPFMPQELVFRVRKALESHSSVSSPLIEMGRCEVDLERHVVTCDGTPVSLTTKEYDLLAFLLRNQNEILTREKIMQEAWGDEFQDTPRSVDNFVKRLRSKVPGLCIETVYGVGYRCIR